MEVCSLVPVPFKLLCGGGLFELAAVSSRTCCVAFFFFFFSLSSLFPAFREKGSSVSFGIPLFFRQDPGLRVSRSFELRVLLILVLLPFFVL